MLLLLNSCSVVLIIVTIITIFETELINHERLLANFAQILLVHLSNGYHAIYST